MESKFRIAGYVKLAKLWERNRSRALEYHQQYYEKKFASSDYFELAGVYVDITGQKEIRNRPEMLRLLRDCKEGRVNCIASQTKGYLAANTGEFCKLIRYLFDMEVPIHILTEDRDYNINTIVNDDHQREELYRMAYRFTEIDPEDYRNWVNGIALGIDRLMQQEGELNGQRKE